MSKKKTTQDLVGMKLDDAYRVAGEMGYMAVCVTGDEKVYKEELDLSYEWIVLKYERNKVVSVMSVEAFLYGWLEDLGE